MGANVSDSRGGELRVANVRSLEELPREVPTADIVVCERLDDGLLADGMLEELAKALKSGRIGSNAMLVPAGARIFCAALEATTGQVSGFDLSPFDR